MHPDTLDSPPMAESKRSLLEPHELAEAAPPEAVRIPLDLVDPNPNNPRGALAEIDLLADNIRQFTTPKQSGLMQPITVRRMGERYEILGGHRRWAAFLKLSEDFPHDPQWRTIPAVIRTADDGSARIMLISAQAHSRAWTPREEAGMLEELASSRTLREVGALVNKSEAWVSKRLKTYADSILSGFVQHGHLSNGVAEKLLIIKDAVVRRDLAERAVAERWTPEKARTEVRRLRLDAQLREVAKRARELAEILSTIDATKLPPESQKDLLLLSRRIQALARGGPVMPTLAEAQKAAGVKPDNNRGNKDARSAKRKPGYKPKVT